MQVSGGKLCCLSLSRVNIRFVAPGVCEELIGFVAHCFTVQVNFHEHSPQTDLLPICHKICTFHALQRQVALNIILASICTDGTELSTWL